MNVVTGDKQAGLFRTFPEFSKLGFADRHAYESFIANYPPIADISFPGLMTWWNTLSSCAVSQLNGNLVISYWFPGDERSSGLSLLGTHKIDESICTIFDHLQEQGRPLRLVHVSEFVIANLRYPELFTYKAERDSDEYVYDISRFYPLHRLASFQRHRIGKFLSNVDEGRIVIKRLDLSLEKNQRLLLERTWPKKGINKLAGAFEEVWRTVIQDSDLLGLDNVCFYIDGKLSGYCLYQRAADRRYVIFKHAKVDYAIPRLLDYMIYALARWFAKDGVEYVNLDSDLGLPFLRMFMLALGPVNYFRKYTIESDKRGCWSRV